MGSEKIFNVLFLCTGNSARSILAEAILNRKGAGRFKAFSAGSLPAGAVHPTSVALLNELGYSTGEFRSKSWDEFAGGDAPDLDFIFTVCDNAAGEVCPVWPGRPMTAHWGIPDPAAADGTDAEKRQAFVDAYGALTRRIEDFIQLPFGSLETRSLQQRLADIGKDTDG
jgi:protein-tyrosine-phosphatase